MAIPKYRGLKLGPGALNEIDGESRFYVEPAYPENGTAATLLWDNGTPYNIGDAVVFEGEFYNSITGSNSGNQPDTSPLDWKYVDGKDGDIWLQTPVGGQPGGGPDAEIYVKVNSIWRPLSQSNPLTIPLIDGQLTPEIAVEYPADVFRYAVIDYTLKRGVGNSRKRKGTLIVLNDGSVIDHTHEYHEIGFEVQVDFTLDVSAGIAELKYTSASEGNPIELRYIIRGW